MKLFHNNVPTKNELKNEYKVEVSTYYDNIMLSSIFLAITISYRMPNMQCHEIHANFMYVY